MEFSFAQKNQITNFDIADWDIEDWGFKGVANVQSKVIVGATVEFRMSIS